MPFSNPIIAGETLVVPGIQSDGYVTGTTGWRVEREGNADFNDVSMRGTLDIVGPDYPTDESRIRILVAGSRPVIQLDDNFGRTYEIGADDNSLYLKALTSPNSGIYIVQDLGIAIRSDATGAPSVLFDDADGLLKVGSYSPWTVDDWVPITYLNGWAARTGGFYRPSVRRNALGYIEIFGSAFKTGGGANGTACGNVPAPYRPANDVTLPLQTNNGNTYGMTVLTNGNINLLHSQGASPTFTTINFSGSYPSADVDPAITP